jgi:primosomal protein N' (replication factor Y) (superfamily II helicase)
MPVTPEGNEIYADVLLPLALPHLFTYRIPAIIASEAVPGKRVIVSFGRQKVYSALIRNIRETHPDPASLKEVQSVLDDLPVVNEKQFELWEWMSEYYMCTQGDVMNCALPAALKLQSETKVLLSPSIDNEGIHLTESEQIMVNALKEKEEMTIDEISRLLKKTSVHQLLKRAFEKGVIILSEEIHERFKPKKEHRLRFAAAYATESELEKLFIEYEQDNRKVKQLEALMIFMKYLYEDKEKYSVSKNIILKHPGLSKSSLQTLISNGVLIEFDRIIERIPVVEDALKGPLLLSGIQQKSFDEIKEAFEKHDVALLHGVTSSGKTEIYIHLIEEAVAAGKQVLYLLPEIALTAQIIVRLQKHFGKKVGIYHSKYSSNQRTEVWNHVLNFNYSEAHFHIQSQIILGARSSLFLPYKNLGLVIVDEEHDTSYKQDDPAPRYNGRDTAIVLAKLHGAKTLLGSATPSIETYHNAVHDKYGMIRLKERHGGMEMPSIIIADMKEAKRKRLMKSLFTPEMLQAVREALAQNEQVIMFQNRRGFSPFIECRQCNWIPHCRNCSVTLTYHKFSNALKCHYCGYAENVPAACPDCGDHHIEVKGFGTEKIEEEMAVFFPEARIARMDMDSTRTRSSFQRILSEFEDRRIDILVGTQMVTKGLDFDNVSTVGIVNADQLLNFPDFRSFERSFQLMAQVSGRSGRKLKRGKVIIQTYQPDHWVIKEVVEHDYEGFYERDLHERKKFGYPPHSRLIELSLRHKDNDAVGEAAMVFAGLLRDVLGNRVLGPHLPLVSKIRNLYYRSILIKADRSDSPSEIKKAIRNSMNIFYANRDNHVVAIVPDVDPL